jgi:peptidoglycan/LPS O-acetylase OafA/YrhL
MIKRIIGILIIILAIGVAVIPQLTKCHSSMMVCPYTVKAELALALPILAEGLVLAAGRKESIFGLAVVGVALGIAVILIPTALIGVDTSPMLCATVMRPTLLILGVILILANLGLLWESLRNRI